MTLERLKNIIVELFNLKDVRILTFCIVMEDDGLSSCICCFETDSFLQKSKLENLVYSMNKKSIPSWQLHKIRKYFNSLSGFKASFDDNILIVKK